MARFRSVLNGNSLTITDTYRANAVVFSSSSILSGQAGGLTTTLTCQEVPEGGCDLTFTVHNGTGGALSLGSINLKYFHLDQSMVVRRNTSNPLPDATILDSQSDSALHYPGAKYSPVEVFTTPRYHVGVSLQYDKAVYGHGVEVHIQGGGAATKQHGVYFRFSCASPSITYTIPAAATFTYTVSIRILPTSGNHWLRTLTPYQAHHHRTIGKVRYAKDGRPILTDAPADTAFFNVSTNPRSWKSSAERPDTHGFSVLAAKYLAAAQAGGYERMLMWSPAGCQNPSTGVNYPPRFFTGIDESGYEAAVASVNAFQSLPAAGIQMGFYWGSSSLYQPTWDSQTSLALFDPTTTAHKTQVAAEMAYVTQAGGTLIGLDAQAVMITAGLQTPIKRALDWISYLQSTCPAIKFIGEQAVPDYAHTRMGNFQTINPGGSPATDISGPWALADFLNPGHETLIQFLSFPSNLSTLDSTTLTARKRYMDRLMSFGFITLHGIPATPPTSTSRAADTWKTHYPDGLITQP